MWKEALVFYLLNSRNDKGNPNLQSELFYITQKSGITEMPNGEEAMKICDTWDIPKRPNNYIISVMVLAGRDAKKHGDDEFGDYCLELAYALEPELREVVENLER